MIGLKVTKLLATFLMLIISIPPAISLQPATLKVRVTDCSTGMPIPNAKIVATERVVDPRPDPIAFTDGDGVVIFSFYISSQTSYSIAVSAEGYNSDGTVAFLNPGMETIRYICLNRISLPQPTPSCNTVVTVSVSPKTIYQADTIAISGRVTASYTYPDPIDPPVYIYVDGSLLVTAGTDSAGYYSVDYTTPSSISLGSHTVRAESTIDGCTKGSATDIFTVLARPIPTPQYCTLDVYVWDQNSNPLDASVSIIGGGTGYDAYGSHVTQQVAVGSYTVSASKSGYSSDSKTVSCSCSQTVRVDLVLRKTQVCVPGTIRNRHCGCTSQVVYEKCKADGSEWITVTENCPSDKICQNGECITPPIPPYECEEGYVDVFQCFDNVRKQKYVFSDCDFIWKFKEDCAFGCSDGSCLVCTPGTIRNKVCLCQKQYQYEKCRSDGSGWDIISGTCSGDQVCVNGECVAVTPTCTEGYLDTAPICNGNWKQRQYKFSNCATEWRNYEYCDYGCSNGNCLPKPCPQPCPAPCPTPSCPAPCPSCQVSCPTCPTYCSISVNVGTPSDVAVGNTIQTAVTLTNNGNRGSYVNFDAYVCESSGNCYVMNCDGAVSDPTVYVDAYDTHTVTCTAVARTTCDPYIKVQYSGCGTSDTIYSNYFRIVQRWEWGCTQGFTKNWRMNGNWKQYEYVYSDCTREWRNYEYVPTVEPVSEAKGVSLPMIALESEYDVKACEISTIEFEVVNAGNQKAKFYLRKSGAAADWIQLESEIVVDAKESKTVTAYVSVPCDAEGSKTFTIKVLDGTTTGATSTLNIETKEEPFIGLTAFNALVDFTFGMWPWLVLFVLLLLALLLFGLAGKNHNTRERPEYFAAKSFKPFREECC